MSKPVVIGICGKARAGKDTLAEMFVDHHAQIYADWHTTISPMAGPIKLMLGNFLFPFVHNDFNKIDAVLYGDAKDEILPPFNCTPRKMMQTLGTEWGRGIDEEIWIKAKKAEITLHAATWEVILIPDIRFDNEADLCDVVVQVVRPHHESDVGEHSSEDGVSPHLIDITVSNDGDLAALRDATPEVWQAVLDALFGMIP